MDGWLEMDPTKTKPTKQKGPLCLWRAGGPEYKTCNELFEGF